MLGPCCAAWICEQLAPLCSSLSGTWVRHLTSLPRPELPVLFVGIAQQREFNALPGFWWALRLRRSFHLSFGLAGFVQRSTGLLLRPCFTVTLITLHFTLFHMCTDPDTKIISKFATLTGCRVCLGPCHTKREREDSPRKDQESPGVACERMDAEG